MNRKGHVATVKNQFRNYLTFMIQKCGALLNIWVPNRSSGDMRAGTCS